MKGAKTAAQAASMIPDGASVMIGGFMAVGSPERVIDALVARGAKGLTIIANAPNPAGVAILREGFPEHAVNAGALFVAALLPTAMAVLAFQAL